MRDQTVDIAKGVGIFLVVLGHFSTFGDAQYHYIYLFHMPLFFFLSGMFTRQTNVKECLPKRARRLLIPYLFYWIYTRLMYVAMGIVAKGNLSLDEISFDILDAGVLWFLISLWTIHIIYSIGGYLGRWQLLLYAGLTTVGLVTTYANISMPLYLNQSFIMLPFFLLGKVFNSAKIIQGSTPYEYITRHRTNAWLWLLPIVVFVVPCDLLDVSGLTIPNIVQFFVTPLSGIMLTLLLCMSLQKPALYLRLNAVGSNSLHIYGLHFPLVFIAWTIAIPVAMHALSFISITVTGEEVKELIPMQWLLAVLTTVISHKVGLFVSKTKLFK